MHNGIPFRGGELDAQMLFNTEWNEAKAARLGQLIGCALDDEKALFIEHLPFFFLATAASDGTCDCSFKGSEPDANGRLLPSVRVVEPRRLRFPDYTGNRMFNSLGNLLQNPHVGMLFIDFASQSRLRINGSARILETKEDWIKHWPNAPRAVEVAIEQVYWNCNKRIPKHP